MLNIGILINNMKITIDLSNISYYQLDQLHAILLNCNQPEASKIVGDLIETKEKEGDYS